MAILFHCAGDDDRHMHDAVADALRDHELRIWPDIGDPDGICYAIVWQAPSGFFDGLNGLRAVLALSAGVDALLDRPDLPDGVPIVRLHDAGMGVRMAEYVLEGVLHAHRRGPDIEAAQREARWDHTLGARSARHCPVGILGAGALAARVAERLVANGYPVACWSRSTREMPDGVMHRAGEAELPALLAGSRVLVNLLPLTDATHERLNGALFDALPRGAFVINVARGEHLVERDLLDALDTGQLSGAWLDVFREEPLPSAHPFWAHPQIRVTPHVAAPSGARASAAQVAQSLALLEAGRRPPGWVERARGY